MSNHFNRTGGLHPKKSAFDLSEDIKLTCDMGELIPVWTRIMNAGDTFKIGSQTVCRFQPLVYPIIHEVQITTHTFFVPMRLLWDNWEKYYTGGKDGNYVAAVPKWNPTPDDLQLFSLWDYFGYPIVNYAPPPNDSRNLPMDMHRRCYNFIIDEYYGDENHDDPINTDADGDRATPPTVWGTNRKVLRRRWKKDYPTSALPFRQRGSTLALPIEGITEALFEDTSLTNNGELINLIHGNGAQRPITQWAGSNMLFNYNDAASTVGFIRQGVGTLTNSVNYVGVNSANTVDLSLASTFDFSALREIAQIQKWMERNARAGVRYTEFLKAHFGAKNQDFRLQRPEYIGGTKSPISINEVLQTSATQGSSAQGNMAGHGLAASDGYHGSYTASEPGIIMSILSVMPTPVYEDGFPREVLYNDKEEWYMPEYAHLSEQAIFNAEIFPSGDETQDMDIWGYQGRYDELRVGRSKVVSEMRRKVPSSNQSLAEWHLARSFTGLPNLNSNFIECNPDKNIFAVPSAKGLIINHATLVKAIRPMPEISEPGLIDHF